MRSFPPSSFPPRNKSLFVNFLKGIRNPPGYDKLSSTRTNQDNQPIKNDNITTNDSNQIITNTNILTFTYKPLNCITPIHFTMPRLIDLETQEPIDWLERFDELAGLSKWSASTALNHFYLLVSKDIIKELELDLETTQGLTQIKTKLINLKYPVSDAPYYIKLLNNTKQTNYRLIDDYYKEIKKNAQKWGACKKVEQSSIQEKIDETFLNNLHHLVEIEMNRTHQNTISEIRETIRTVERSILRTLPTQIQSNINQQIPQNRRQLSKQNQNIYCKYHKTTYHDTKDCNFLKAQIARKGTNKPSEEKNFFIDDQNKDSTLYLSLLLNNFRFNAIIDTGSKYSFLNSRIIKDTQLSPKLGEPISIQFGNSATEEITTSVDCLVTVNIDKKFYKKRINFLVSDNIPCDSIIGMDFIMENFSYIDFQSRNITLKKDIPIPSMNNYIILDRTEKESIPDDDIKTSELKTKVKDLLDYFHQKTARLGLINDSPFEIILTSEIPIQCKEYPVPIAERDKLRTHLKELINQKIIKLSSSNYSSPAFTTKKPNGDIRLLIDYRKLNLITKIVPYPFPSIRDQFIDLRGSTIFSLIDLKQGYYQIPILESDTYKTAFSILGNKYEFMRLPFGLKNAPFFFQKTMHKILSKFPFVKVFIDDILIFSRNEIEHYQHLELVLTTLKNANVSINPDKCQFAQQTLKFLGYKISEQGYQADISRIDKFEDFKPPASKRSLMRLVGFLQWFRPFIVNMSKKIESITDKLKKGKFEWKNDDTLLIKKIIHEIKNQTLLAYPEPGEPYELYTDASNSSLGAVLIQNGKVVALYSYKLNQTELNYSTSEKEYFAIVKSLFYLKTIIFGSNITVYTDNRNICFVKDVNSPRIQRWITLIRDFNYEIKFIEGKANVVADFLSRDVNSTKILLIDQKLPSIDTLKSFSLNPENKFIVPENQIENILNDLHINLGHPGYNTFLNTVKEIMVNPSLTKRSKQICDDCILCKQIKTRPTDNWVYVGDLLKVQPCEVVSTDIAGPFTIEIKPDELTKIWILSATDLCTRFSKVSILTDIKAETVTSAFEEIWLKKYATISVLSDNGRQYTSRSFVSLLKKYNVSQFLTRPYNPRGNSKSERINKAINEILRFTQIGFTTKQIKQIIENRLNLTFNRSIQCTPYELFLSKNGLNENIVRDNTTLLETSINNSKKLTQYDKQRLNNKRVSLDLKQDDFIFVKQNVSSKQDLPFDGPFKVLKVEVENNGIQYEYYNRKPKWTNARFVFLFKRG
ncbi:pol polyprotein [Pseudoloma neurophilia]|uniref:RNA-directed DNA polymerase n=1 Tax=Pseudoloma neurophilia TaxID=146866 RepID=A0A0R0M291_9MICR|nr:pol polyprotein [Pseudoloma neurophilia]